MIDNLIIGITYFASWQVIAALLAGAVAGYIVGAIPGIGPTLGIALLIPFTYGMDPAAAMVGLVSLYVASEYGCAITAILINTPGSAAAVATAWDGYPLAQRGEAGLALTVAIVASGFAALVSTVLLIVTAVPLAEVALLFGPTEYFALALLGLSLVSALSSGSAVKGFGAMFFGLMLVTIGLDPSSGVPRFTVTTDLFEGLPLVPCLVGLYAISEVLFMIERVAETPPPFRKLAGALTIPKGLIRELNGTMMRSSLIGYIIGVIPGPGPTVASLVAYGDARRRAKDPSSFGKGNIHGVAASEAANNSAVPGALAPLLALGIPGSGTTAILIGALTIQGVEPGPLLFSRHPEIPYTLFVSLLLSIPIMVLMGLAGARIWAKASLVPLPILAAVVTIVSIAGAYVESNSMFSVYVTLAMGLIGYAFRKVGIPLAPIVLALVLGELMETNFRRAMLASGGDYMIFLTSPITIGLLLAALLSFALPILRRRPAGPEAEEEIT